MHKSGKELEGVSKFGFHVNTCCGNLEMNNTWKDDWPVSRMSILARFEIRKKAKIGNRYNQVPHLTRDQHHIWESDKNTRKHYTQENQVVRFSPVDDHTAARKDKTA